MITFDRRAATAVLACLWALLLVASAVQDALVQAGLAQRVWRLDVDAEQSVYTWFSTLLLAACGLTLLAIGRARPAPERLPWLVLAAGFAALSLDEAVSLHEQLSARLSEAFAFGGAFTFAWTIPAAIGVAVLLVLFVPFLRTLPRRVAALFLLSGALFVGGAVGLEMAAGRLLTPVEGGLAGFDDPAYRALVHVEEGLEGAGALLFLSTLWSYAASLDLRVAVGPQAAPEAAEAAEAAPVAVVAPPTGRGQLARAIGTAITQRSRFGSSE